MPDSRTDHCPRCHRLTISIRGAYRIGIAAGGSAGRPRGALAFCNENESVVPRGEEEAMSIRIGLRRGYVEVRNEQA